MALCPCNNIDLSARRRHILARVSQKNTIFGACVRMNLNLTIDKNAFDQARNSKRMSMSTLTSHDMIHHVTTHVIT